MRKLLFLAIPLVLLGFTLPGKTLTERKPDLQVAGSLTVTCCTGSEFRVKITGTLPNTPIYWHIDGIYVGTGNKYVMVPFTANSVYATTGATYPGVMYQGNMVNTLSCPSVCP